ncbi:CPBP family intramembrane glutamic endopeptidase [Antrihabitans cavernicola]|uniref:CPBP family intramembrane metalloprotease n=1 Tax=Antrihabitans cavernicola TaxID=2495913 RepID=A0A5A7S7K3_9NOCA|nr:CPBP family intramembrane glutamic endopeptidase [Spelaeibacter cavernicola]KAA0021876.1 CPBP family intramembrane metalloprotease [Spelaeibacter cavernicola]
MRVVAAAAPVVWSNLVLPNLRLGMRGRTAANATFATAYALALNQPVPLLTARGVRWGIAAGLVPTAGYAVALAVPRFRRTIADRSADSDVAFTEWLLVHIPVGTVYSEEVVFRKTLDPMLGTPAAAAVFGLWHIQPARAAGDNVIGTVVVTAAAGLVFGWLRRRTNSVIAPALAHLAINAGGAVATRVAGRGGW